MFEWQWPYGADEESDKLIDVNANFHLNITATAMVTPGAIPVFNDGVGVASELAFVAGMSGLILTSGIWLLFLFFRRKFYFTGIIAPVFNGEVTYGKLFIRAAED